MRGHGAALSLIATLTSSACAPDERVDEAPPPPRPGLSATDPSAPGPYRVGVTTISAGSGDRILPVELWYPANPDGDAEATRYPLIVGVLELASVDSPLGAVRDAPLAREGAPHPLIVFSHGNLGFRFQSVYLTEYLASHGFVVAAPDHLGNTFVDGSMPAGESAKLRPGDLSTTLDAVLSASERWPGALYLAADPDRVGVAGHSFGGFTALRIAGGRVDAAAVTAACETDPSELVCKSWDGSIPSSQRDDRFITALSLSPGGAFTFGAEGFAAVEVPVMLQGGTHDHTTPLATEQAVPFEDLPSPAYLVSIEGAGHFTFSDVCNVADQLGVEIEALSDGCTDADIDPTTAHAIINLYATAFFKLTLEGDTSVRPLLSEAGPLPAGVADFQAK